eukprot:TRINITY_DN3001_c0_g2_i2.p1 TRINITY_DN3001_c0_g2~~TRINITY_DN3001_c0_g2_i2.p1  ORF type:complete len:431 (-),score=58.32 TRINITY_DN3001_c0_g2_i2:117-1409(-)
MQTGPVSSSQFQNNISGIESQDLIQKQQVAPKMKNSFLISFVVFKAIVGGGILGSPYAINKCGWLLGSIVAFVISLISLYTVGILLKVWDDIGKRYFTYPDLAELVGGSKIGLIVRIIMGVYLVSVVISYCIVFQNFLRDQFVNRGIDNPEFKIIVMGLMIILPLGLIRDIKNAQWIGACGFILSTSCLLIMIINDITFVSKNGINKKIDSVNFSGIPYYSGVAAVAFMVSNCMFNIREEMEEPQRMFSFIKPIMMLALGLTVLLCTFSIFHYGNDVKQIILFNHQNEGWSSDYIKIGYSLAILTGYPILQSPLLIILEKIVFQKREEEKTLTLATLPYKNWGFRLVLTLFIFMIGYCIPKFSDYLNLCGGLFAISLQYIFPSLLFLIHFKNSISQTEKYINYTLIVIFGLAAICSIYYSTVSLLSLIHI